MIYNLTNYILLVLLIINRYLLYNQLYEIPSEIGNLSNLEELYVIINIYYIYIYNIFILNIK